MKQRVSSLDLKLLVSEIEKTIKGYRLQNVNNLAANPRSFLLKFNIPDSKVNVVLESGFKLYITEFQRPTQPEPSVFTQKLRKHLKTRRMTNIKQVGDDRIAVLEFSDGMYFLVLEFFSAGNIILLDENLKILTLFRAVDATQNKSEVLYNIGAQYTGFDKSIFEEEDDQAAFEFTSDQVLHWAQAEKEKESKKVFSIAKLCFMKAVHLSSDLIQISLSENEVNPSQSCLELLNDEQLLANTVKSLNSTTAKLNKLLQTPVGHLDGYIISAKNPLFDDSKEASLDNLKYIYDEFHPYDPVHKIKDSVIVEKYKGYNKTVDKFFTTIEMSKSSLSRQTQKANAEKRLQFVKDEQTKKLDSLSAIQELNAKKGSLIMMFSNEIEECKKAVQYLLDKQTDWQNIEKMIQLEKTRGNNIAKMIKSLNLLKNEITVSLPNDDYDSSDEDSGSESQSDSDSDSETENTENNLKPKNRDSSVKTIDVIIDLKLSAFANSSRYYTVKKSAQEKQKKTEEHAVHAIKSSEKKIEQDLKKMQKESKQNVEFKQLRPKHWFEKFYWFISSDGYLCIAGRDTTQIDIIYYKYFDNETDVLISNDLDDSLQVFVKNPYTNKEIPISTLMQAGVYSLSTTKAWENKNVLSPWCVVGRNVSKKDFDGTILPPGLLNFSKDKEYLPPCQLNMGAGLLWIGNEETNNKYKNVRRKYIEDLELNIGSNEINRVNKISELKEMLGKLKVMEAKENAKDGNKDDKKEGSLESSAEASDEITVLDVSEYESSSQSQSNVRGKKNKLKKIKEKYGDQDAEERRMRMSVLGTLKQFEQKTEVSTETDNATKKDTSLKRQRVVQQKIHQLNKLIEEFETADVIEDENQEEDVLHASVDKDPYYIEIESLRSSPDKSDVVLDCVPVFAPWQSLQKYVYKVKIIPGNLKKGKTVAEITQNFNRQTKSLQKEGTWFDKSNLTEIINQQEFMASLTASKYKLSSAGPTSQAQKGKGGKSGKGKKK